MLLTAWKHKERNRHRDRQMYIQKFRRLRDSFKMPVNIILKSLPSNYLKTLDIILATLAQPFHSVKGLLNNRPTRLKNYDKPRAYQGSLFRRPCHNASPLPNLYRKWSHETSSFMHTFHLIHNHQAYFRVPNKHFDLNK